MPEYLAPGVFVEEVSYRSKSIQGVATSTTGFVGAAHSGPVRYFGGPLANEPRLVTNYAEFERVYGDLRPIEFAGGPAVPYLAHAARAYFLNGGRRLYVSRVYAEAGVDDATTPSLANAVVSVPPADPNGNIDRARFRARWPGKDGNATVSLSALRGGDLARHPDPARLPQPTVDQRLSTALLHGMIVEVVPTANAGRVATMPAAGAPIVDTTLRVVWRALDGTVQLIDKGGAVEAAGALPWTSLVLPITVTVAVVGPSGRSDVYPRLSIAPQAPGSINRVLSWDDPSDDTSAVAFEYFSLPPGQDGAPAVPSLRPPTIPPTPPPASGADPAAAVGMGRYISILTDMIGAGTAARTFALLGGTDGSAPGPEDYRGADADPDDPNKKATGLNALAEVDDIAIVAGPDIGAMADPDERFTAAQFLVRHAEACRYRIAVVDGPRNASLNQIRSFRGNFDSTYAAIYHPWLEILDPNGAPAPGVPAPHLFLPPSGFVTGIYARNDISRGVFKAPANEVVYGLTRFEMNINTGRNEVLNPENINAMRFFSGRGNRVWGARTMSSDPEWLYVNVRRFFIFLEHSIDKSTQWAVFEPNGPETWRKVAQQVTDFLELQWVNGALLGNSPEEAFFVLCDRSTMTQNDLDNGRLICLVGVAPVKPAEFVIFRIGQWTAAAKG